MALLRLDIYLSEDEHRAILDYYRLNDHRFRNPSQAAAYQLRRALAIPEGADGLLLDRIEKAVGDSVRKTTSDLLDEKLEEQTNRFIGVLVNGGKYAYAAYALAARTLGQVTGDRDGATRIARDTWAQSGQFFSRDALDRDRKAELARRRGSREA